MDTLKRVAVASERPVHPRVGEGSARDKFRVSGTKEMVEGAGANKVSEVLSEASGCRCGTSNFTKERVRCNTELFTNKLFNVIPSNFWGSHHFSRPLSLEYPFHAEAWTRSESLAGAEIV